jgi:hypothetical protein
MTEVTALDRAKTIYYEDAQATLRGENSTVTKEQVESIYDSLSEDENKQFAAYQVEVDATMYNFLMQDMSSDLRSAIDLFIQDGVQRMQGLPKVPDEDRSAALAKIQGIEVLTAMQLINHPIVRAVVYKKLMDKGMSYDDILHRVDVMNAEVEAETAVKAA